LTHPAFILSAGMNSTTVGGLQRSLLY